ncbi:hypothetical protein ASPWEDRAFT_48321 [Aspergillus wentii DTO 134E9]|uniref:Myb-like domain-containing protein n=1 Tax=Aspergillus wentii DTO 134E9 TaxID=1073089 RepID=A0A1L9S3V7_ASPWE|nr:uncharacterized protein ASPWEDRAFT_48321 [Aspergillus wentii DTO 134E9]OJJ41842.1 hypothetical protein ASPWEDRAFT_48321 [Aspergillus wentii DTO 134E9]
MKASALYEPEEDEERSESDTEYKRAASKVPPSSPPIQSLRISSSVASAEQDESELVPRCSRGTRDEVFDDLRRSMKKESVEAYSKVLEDAASDIAPIPTNTSGESYNVTRNGIVTWTAREKEVLFNILDRKGKNGIKEIAKTIGTKSELEVQDHLKLLHKGLERQHLRDRHSRTVILGDIPATSEISEKCCRVLDNHAEFLSLEEQYSEDVAGRQKHHDAWIIDHEKAEEIDEQVRRQGNEVPTNSSVYLSASLLNMKRWIHLSHRFFMNAGGPRLEDNWVNVAFADETPSMTADAYGDFYSLAISVTRRLVQSSIFFAMSRLRNMRDTGNLKAKVVKPRDVKTALEVLNMKRDSSDFWVGLARRCSLEVADLRHKKGWNAVCMDHDEVEDVLSGKMSIDVMSERSVSQVRSGSRFRDRRSDNEDMDDNDDSHSDTNSRASAEPVTGEEEQPSDLEDEHAENVDQKSSGLEELQLWQLLGQRAPSQLESLVKDEEVSKTVRKPVGDRKTQQELVDWRDRTLYRSDWEEYGSDTFDLYEDLSENRRKRRRLCNSQRIGTDPAQSQQGSQQDFKMTLLNGDHDNTQPDAMDLDENPSSGPIAENETTENRDSELAENLPFDMDENGESGYNPHPAYDHISDQQAMEPEPEREESGSEAESYSDSLKLHLNPDREQTNPESKEEDHGSDADSASDSHLDSENDAKPNTSFEQSQPGHESESEYQSDSDNDVKPHTSPTRFKQESIKPNSDEEYTSDDSDDNVPADQRLVKTYSSDEDSGIPLYSRPLSPAD